MAAALPPNFPNWRQLRAAPDAPREGPVVGQGPRNGTRLDGQDGPRVCGAHADGALSSRAG